MTSNNNNNNGSNATATVGRDRYYENRYLVSMGELTHHMNKMVSSFLTRLGSRAAKAKADMIVERASSESGAELGVVYVKTMLMKLASGRFCMITDRNFVAELMNTTNRTREELANLIKLAVQSYAMYIAITNNKRTKIYIKVPNLADFSRNVFVDFVEYVCKSVAPDDDVRLDEVFGISNVQNVEAHIKTIVSDIVMECVPVGDLIKTDFDTTSYFECVDGENDGESCASVEDVPRSTDGDASIVPELASPSSVVTPATPPTLDTAVSDTIESGVGVVVEPTTSVTEAAAEPNVEDLGSATADHAAAVVNEAVVAPSHFEESPLEEQSITEAFVDVPVVVRSNDDDDVTHQSKFREMVESSPVSIPQPPTPQQSTIVEQHEYVDGATTTTGNVDTTVVGDGGDGYADDAGEGGEYYDEEDADEDDIDDDGDEYYESSQVPVVIDIEPLELPVIETI